MAGIVGTITNLSDFLSKTQVCLSVKPNDPQQQIICLEADRKYSIPAFQREVRWDDNNLKMLLYDLSRSSKFLGNIILTIKSDHTCEIIDGQQRTTVLMLIVSCIKKKFGTKILTPDLCPLRNEGFTGFQTLLEKAFDQEAITSDDWNAILKSDDYHQLPRIQKLWNTISSSELLADRHKAQGLLDNLCKSEFNIIASYSNDVNTSIQYFLDVNLKGIRLDTEDIFKGYLFSQDSRELTRSLWQKNKRDVLRLNGVTQSSEEKRYPLMKLYEHFFYCDLYLPREGDCEYSTLKFGENFCLTSGFESGSTKYYEGSHLIEAIRDRDYLQNVLSRLNKCVEIMTDIIESEGPSTPFKDKFICAKKVDSIDIQNCHSMLKKILMEKEVIPKILALKYILTYFDGKPHAKEEYKSVYSVFCAAVLFTVFANKKESDTFYNFVRLEEWKSKINKWLYDYISSHALTRGKVLAAYKYSESDDDPIQQIRCKSLAAISNFFKVTKNGDNYNMGISNAAELCKFFGDKTVYSLEHFIVGECGTLHVKTAKYDFPYKYPPTIQKYRNSLFNFIFIPQPLNSSLSNEGLFIKVAEIHTHENEIKCSYSKGYYYQIAPFKVSSKCCYYLKEKPCSDWAKEHNCVPYLGLMASEGGRREKSLMLNGCNYFGKGTIRSAPFAIFNRQDLLQLALDLKVPIPEIYGSILKDEDGRLYTSGEQRTGCSMCGFGIQLEKRPHRFDRLRERNYKEWDFWMNRCCLDENGTPYGWGKVLDYLGIGWRDIPDPHNRKK